MKEATKTLVTEIGSLLTMSNSFNARYDNDDQHNVSEALYEDFVYFHKRTKYIFESINDHSATGFLNRFHLNHIRFDKNPIHDLKNDLTAITVRMNILKKELENGLIFNITDLAKSEVFSNFLESGKYLLDEGWKDAAAIIIGGVLEDELRNLCLKKDLPTKTERGKNLTIEPMNENLCKAGIYNLLKQKRITALADIRNNAAHAHYDQYTKEDILDMYNFVLDFDF